MNDTDRKPCWLYLRVSTQLQTLDNQRPELVRYARMKGWDIRGVYEEKASTAKARTEFDRMMLAAHRGEFAGGCIVVWALDRFGRSLVGNLNTILQLDQLGVPVVSLREPWLDMSRPVRQLLIAIFSWLGEQERIRNAERSRAGIERARRQGKVLGRPRKFVPLEEAVRLRGQGLSIARIAEQLGRAGTPIGVSTLHRALQEHDALQGADHPECPEPQQAA